MEFKIIYLSIHFSHVRLDVRLAYDNINTIFVLITIIMYNKLKFMNLIMHWIFNLAIAFTGVVVFGGKSLGAVAVLRLVELLAADYLFRALCSSRLPELLLCVSSYLLFVDHITFQMFYIFRRISLALM